MDKEKRLQKYSSRLTNNHNNKNSKFYVKACIYIEDTMKRKFPLIGLVEFSIFAKWKMKFFWK